MRNIFVFLGALLLVDGVFGVDETLSVMEGDSVTLKPDTVIPEDDPAEWWFGKEIIARKKAAELFSISEDVDVRFQGRLNLDHQTGSLTITNITTKDTGLYKLQIRSINKTSKIFSVTVSGDVFGDDVNLSVMEGDSVTLNPDTEITEDDSALWWFGGKIIARMNKAAGLFSTSEGVDGRFKGKLNLDHQNGSLTITNIRTDHTGLYKLQIRSTTETFKIFSVTVSGSGLSPGVIAVIVVGVLLLLAAVAGLIYYRRKNSELQRRLDAKQNGTNYHLKAETANSDD